MTGFPSSLVRGSLELGRVLAERDGVRFRAMGTCMYPSVRPGDVLHIQPRRVADVAVGDIAVCRHPEHLFGHRVVRKGECEGRDYIVTRADRGSDADDGRTFDEDLLGVVVRIERDGRPAPMGPFSVDGMSRWSLAARLALLEARPRVRGRLIGAVSLVQDLPAYRRLARRCFELMDGSSRLSCRVRIPASPALGDVAYREVDPKELGPGGRRPSCDRVTLVLRYRDDHVPAASITFARGATGEWDEVGASVRMRYRGLGLHEILRRRAQGILAEGRP